MEEPNTTRVGENVGRKRRVICHTCQVRTEHTVIASATDVEHVMHVGVEVGVVETAHDIVQCDGCKAISYRECWSPRTNTQKTPRS